jgi:hypothetical protein
MRPAPSSSQRMSQHRDTKHILKRLRRALPMLILVSVFSVLAAHYVFRIPAEQTGVAAGVPLISLFLVRRLLLDFLPAAPDSDKSKAQAERPPAWFLFLGIIVFLSALTCMASLTSAGLYRWVGYTMFAKTSLWICLATLTSAVIGFIILLLTAMWENICALIIEISKDVFLGIPRFFANTFTLRILQQLHNTLVGH